MSNIQKQHKISPAIAWLTIQKFIIFYCPLDGEHTIYLTKDGDSFFVSACFLDEETQKLSKDEQIRTVDRHCIAEFLDKKGINTRGKLLKILKDGYQMYKDNLGIEDEFELQRDSFWADMDED